MSLEDSTPIHLLSSYVLWKQVDSNKNQNIGNKAPLFYYRRYSLIRERKWVATVSFSDLPVSRQLLALSTIANQDISQ